YVFQTKEKVFVLASSGTGGMECAVANLVSPGDKVVVLACGAFGERWVKILTTFGANVVPVRSEWGSAVKPAELEKTLRENLDVRAVFCTHTDTSTAVACDVQGYGKIVSKTSAILVVDAISGLGGQELYMDDWKLDVVVSASQKGLMAAPGLAFVAVSQKGWGSVISAKSPRFYWDLRAIEKAFHSGQTPFTPAISLIRSVNVSLNLIREKTIQTVWKETQELAQYTRSFGKSLGLQMFPKDACEVLTSFIVPDGLDGEKIIQEIVDKHNISLAGGQEKLKGKVVRVAHMGYIQKEDIRKGMEALAESLSASKVSAGS
ncbi:MAG: alanine--glyoxylate aminotransferase family protein, partial [Elusimicrobia bacterium]|nr:alanine--glyoxylate aminotransferase family protein [Elusimicrobiota bacterium]